MPQILDSVVSSSSLLRSGRSTSGAPCSSPPRDPADGDDRETFSALLSLSNDLPVLPSSSSVALSPVLKVEMHTTGTGAGGGLKHLLKTITPLGDAESLSPGDSVEGLVSHEVKELGVHALVCTVTYAVRAAGEAGQGLSPQSATKLSRSFRKASAAAEQLGTELIVINATTGLQIPGKGALRRAKAQQLIQSRRSRILSPFAPRPTPPIPSPPLRPSPPLSGTRSFSRCRFRTKGNTPSASSGSTSNPSPPSPPRTSTTSFPPLRLPLLTHHRHLSSPTPLPSFHLKPFASTSTSSPLSPPPHQLFPALPNL
mgnify:CR=1 FL=1